MDPAEIQAKATIVAALIATHAVDVPSMPKHPHAGREDEGAVRLRELTDYVSRDHRGHAVTAAERIQPRR